MGDTLSSLDTGKTKELALNTVSGRVSGLAGALWLAAIVIGYAYLGDISPEQNDVSEPVELDAG